MGFAPGAPLSILVPLIVYAAIQREMGQPLEYPGVAYGPAIDVADTRIVAQALVWG